jgi:hypothetical protein
VCAALQDFDVSELLLDMQHYLEDLEIDGTQALCRTELLRTMGTILHQLCKSTDILNFCHVLLQARPLSCSVL